MGDISTHVHKNGCTENEGSSRKESRFNELNILKKLQYTTLLIFRWRGGHGLTVFCHTPIRNFLFNVSTYSCFFSPNNLPTLTLALTRKFKILFSTEILTSFVARPQEIYTTYLFIKKYSKSTIMNFYSILKNSIKSKKR